MVGKILQQDFHSAGGVLSITCSFTPFYWAGGEDTPSRKRMRVRRSRHSLSSAETFSACCREHGPRERTRAVTIALPFNGLGTHLLWLCQLCILN